MKEENSIAQLKLFLREMFQFNANDLDFGIYRIYNLKRKEIEHLINGMDELCLEPIINKTLELVSNIERTVELTSLTAYLRKFNQENLVSDPAGNYQKIEQLILNFGSDDVEKEHLKNILTSSTKEFNITDEIKDKIYNHILGFFEMYYSNGDFGYNNRSRNLYKVAYEADYDGTDTMFHWKHKGSYYIKTGTSFNAIRFKLKHLDKEFELRLETNEDSKGEGTARNSNKDTKLKHYRFNRFEEVNGITRIVFNFSNSSTTKAELFKSVFENVLNSNINLDNYLFADGKPVLNDLTDDYEKVQDGSVKGIGALRVKRETLLNKINKNFGKENKIKIIEDEKSNQKYFSDQTLETLYNLDQNLNSFYIGNDSDYFIHENLQEFLSAEKERYIKYHILSDLKAILDGKLDNTTLILAKAFDLVSTRIIEFLSTIEEFQKKLFTMKKKVVESEYCITIDCIDEKYYKQILANKDQLAEWKNLFDITVKTIADLKNQPTLVLDTKLFKLSDGSNPFKDNILNEVENLDDQTNGVLVSSENWQALNLLQEKYRGKIKFVYIDPPYNTGGDGFLYKDSFKHSSWVSMVNDRLRLSHSMILPKGLLYSSIDFVERSNLEMCLSRVFGNQNRVEEIIWVQNSNKNQSPTFSTNHEYISVYAKDLELAKKESRMFRETKPGLIEINELVSKLNPDFPSLETVENALKNLYKEHKQQLLEEDIQIDDWKGLYNYNRAEYRDKSGKYVEESDAKSKNAKLWIWRESDVSMPQVKEDSQKQEFRDPQNPEFRFYQPKHPLTGELCPYPKRGWAWPYEPYGKQTFCFKDLALDNRIAWGNDAKKVPQVKRFLHEVETNVSKSVINDYSDGEKELFSLFGKSRSFSNPKPTSLISKLIGQANCQTDFCMDYFAGSGTTGHAVIALNKKNKWNNKYLLIEVGKYFESVTKARIQKVIYSQNWKDGKPIGNDGSKKHIFKYIVLEQYEDVLDAIEQFKEETPKSLPLKYLYKPELNKLNSNISLSEPFSNKIKYGQPTKEGFVDLVDTYNYLQGHEVKSNKTYELSGKRYRVVETIDTLVIWRDIQIGEDDSKKIIEIAEKYPKVSRIELNYDFNILTTQKGHQLQVADRMIQVSIIHADIFNQ